MNLLFIGDVVGQSGCDFLESRMYKLKREYDIDVTVVNGEILLRAMVSHRSLTDSFSTWGLTL